MKTITLRVRRWQDRLERLRLAVHVLRGRPLVYRVEFVDGMIDPQPGGGSALIVAECSFTSRNHWWAQHGSRPWVDHPAAWIGKHSDGTVNAGDSIYYQGGKVYPINRIRATGDGE